MNLFLFKLKLLVYLGGFLFNLFFSQAKKAKPLLLIVFFLFLILSLVFFYFVKNSFNKEESPEDPSYSPTRPDLYIKSEKTKAKIQEEIVFWEAVIEKQPNSRDALINLSILKRSVDQNEDAEILWSKAKAADPTNPIFLE